VQHLDRAAEFRQLLTVFALDLVEYRLQSFHALDQAGGGLDQALDLTQRLGRLSGQQHRQPAPEDLETVDQRILRQPLVAEREEVESADEVEVLDLGLGNEPAVDAALLLDQHLLIEERLEEKEDRHEKDAGGQAEAAEARPDAFQQIDARSVI